MFKTSAGAATSVEDAMDDEEDDLAFFQAQSVEQDDQVDEVDGDEGISIVHCSSSLCPPLTLTIALTSVPSSPRATPRTISPQLPSPLAAPSTPPFRKSKQITSGIKKLPESPASSPLSSTSSQHQSLAPSHKLAAHTQVNSSVESALPPRHLRRRASITFSVEQPPPKIVPSKRSHPASCKMTVPAAKPPTDELLDVVIDKTVAKPPAKKSKTTAQTAKPHANELLDEVIDKTAAKPPPKKRRRRGNGW